MKGTEETGEVGPRQSPGWREETGAAIGEGNGEASLGASLDRRVFSLRTLASFAVAFVVLALLATRVKIDIAGTLRAIEGANLVYYLLALAVFYLIFPIRALRWRRMLLNSGWRHEDLPSVSRLAEIILISFFVNCLVPAKLGDVYRAYLLKQRSALSGAKAGGTIVAERLLDLSTLLLLAGSAGLVVLWGQREKLAMLIVPLEIIAGLVLVAALGLIAMRFWSSWLRGLLPPRLRGFYARFEEGAVGSFGSYHLLLPLSLLAWLAEAARLYFVVRALGLTLGGNPIVEMAIILMVALVGSLLTALPLTPAGLGFVESGIVGVLVLVGVADQGVAFSIAVLDRTISYASLVALGLVVYFVSRVRGPKG